MSIGHRDDPAVDEATTAEEATLRKEGCALDRRLRQARSYGSVEGFVEHLSTGAGETCFSIRSRIDNRLVICRDDEGILATTGAGVGARVDVTGMIVRDEEGRPATIAVDRVYLFPADDTLPSPSEIRGIFPDLTGGMDPTEWIRMRRRGR